jgi:hypothetical protein
MPERTAPAANAATVAAAKAAAAALSRARIAACKPTLLKSSIRDSTLKEIVKSAVHQGAVNCTTYEQLAAYVALGAIRASGDENWNAIACTAPCLALRTRVGSVAQFIVPCLACELQASDASTADAPVLMPPAGARITVLVYQSMPMQQTVQGETPILPPTAAATAGGGVGKAVAGSAAAATGSEALSLSVAAAAAIEPGHDFPGPQTRQLLAWLGGQCAPGNGGLWEETEAPLAAALRDRLTRLYGSTWQVVISACHGSRAKVKVRGDGRGRGA